VRASLSVIEDASGSETIAVDDVGSVRYLTIQNERRRNSLTREMVRSMVEAVSKFDTDPAVRVLIIRGAGDQAFCAGADLKEMAELQADGRPFKPVMPALFDLLLGLKKPAIAALNGDAVGGGFELALCCDLRIARAGARVGLPEVGLAMIPRYGTALVSRMSSVSVALELALGGDLRTAETAMGLRLVNRVVAVEKLEMEIQKIAERLADHAAVAVAGIKYVAHNARSMSLSEIVNCPQATAAFASEERASAVAQRRQR
jgi:enoyl-CoA hydratase